MSERPVAIDSFHVAVFDDDNKTVHFKKLTLSGMADSYAPQGYKIPEGYRVTAPPRYWAQPSAGWVV